MKIRINNRKSFNYIVILIFGILFSIPLFCNNLNIYNGSGFYSIAKGFDFAKNFTINDGRIMCSFFNYIGTGNTILTAPLSSILLVVSHYFFKSYILSYKAIAFFSIIISGIYMYKFSEKISQNENLSLLSSLLYMGVPIHLGQMYLNNSLDNILVFVFIPIAFLGLYKMFNTTENSFYFAIGLIGLILTDLKLTFVTILPILVYMIIHIKDLQTEHCRKDFIISLIAIISIAAFFVFPYVETTLSTQYVESNKTKIEFISSAVSLKSLFITTKDSENVLELGPHILIMLAFSIMAFRKQQSDEKKQYIFAFTTMLIYIFMSTKIFPWNLFPKCISKIENSYNFLIVAAFFECYVCATNMSVVLKKFQIRDVLIIGFISFIYVFALKGFIPYVDDLKEIDNYDISKIVEYRLLPKKAKDNFNYIIGRSRDVEIIKGAGEILDKNKYLTCYTCKTNTLQKDTIYEFPYIYYPGYEVLYDGIHADCFESENGMLAIKMDPEKETHFELNYVGTDLMNYSKIISAVGFCIFSFYVYRKR